MESTNKQVLYISYDGMTDSLGQSQVIPYLIGLTKEGFNITILSCEKHDNYLKNRKMIRDLLDANGISWNPVFYTKRPPVLSAIYDCYKLKKTTARLHKKLNFKIIHCRSYISSIIGLWMSEKHGVPFIFDMRGFWADERVDGGLWNLNNPIFKSVYSFFKKKELEFLNRSAAIISLTNAGKNEILTWKGANIGPDKITVIPCCVDTDLFNPDNLKIDSQLELKKSLKIEKNDFIIGYLGSIGTWYMLDDMLAFFAQLKTVINNAKFLFVTPNSLEEITTRANYYNIDLDSIIVTQAGRNDVPLMISLFDYGLFFIKPSYSKISSSPTKQGEIMAMGIPVICNSGVGDTDKIIELYKAGIVIKNQNFNDAIQSILNGIEFNKYDIRAGAIDYFSLNKGVDQYTKVYSDIELRAS